MGVADLNQGMRAKLAAMGIRLADATGLAENIAAVQGKVTSRGGRVYALLEVAADQATALAESDGADPTLEAGGCPGDAVYVPPAPGTEVRRTLACLVRDRLAEAWSVPPVPPGQNAAVLVMLTPEQGTDWLSHLDASTTALVDERPSLRKPEHKRNGGRHHVFASQDPLDDGDDRSGA